MMKLFGVRYYLLSLVIIATCNVVGMEPKDRTDFRLSLAPKAELFLKHLSPLLLLMKINL